MTKLRLEVGNRDTAETDCGTKDTVDKDCGKENATEEASGTVDIAEGLLWNRVYR